MLEKFEYPDKANLYYYDKEVGILRAVKVKKGIIPLSGVCNPTWIFEDTLGSEYKIEAVDGYLPNGVLFESVEGFEHQYKIKRGLASVVERLSHACDHGHGEYDDLKDVVYYNDGSKVKTMPVEDVLMMADYETGHIRILVNNEYYTSMNSYLRYNNYEEINNEGSVIYHTSLAEKMKFSDEQRTAIDEFKKAAKKLRGLDVELIMDGENNCLMVANGKNLDIVSTDSPLNDEDVEEFIERVLDWEDMQRYYPEDGYTIYGTEKETAPESNN